MLFLIRIFSLLPLSVLYLLADYVIYPLVRYVVRYRLKLVRKNIRLSFPEKAENVRNTIINAYYHHFADILVEIIYGYRVSDEEMRIIDGYLSKYGIVNKSRWMRETLLAFIHRNLDLDYPTLFNEHGMRR